jgi:hypothetical protein
MDRVRTEEGRSEREDITKYSVAFLYIRKRKKVDRRKVIVADHHESD